MTGRLALAVLFLSTAHGAVVGEGDPGCPQVYRVHGEGSGPDTLDILVLPDGFTEKDLPLFRCSVAILVDGLLHIKPFDAVASAINVYRIDQIAAYEGIEVPDGCPHDARHPFGAFSATGRVAGVLETCDYFVRTRGWDPKLGEPVFSAGSYCESCTHADLDFFHDRGVSTDCRVVWTTATGLRTIWALTRCAPKVDIVVVVANSVALAGAGIGDAHPPISVVTLAAIDHPKRRAEILAHELGHALGLLDEYPSATGERPEFFAGRNVVRRRPDGTIETPPWAEHCTDVEGQPADACTVVSACPTPPDGQDMPEVGLIEGAFYSPCDFFRASDDCVLNTRIDYCVGCRVYLEKVFRDLGLLPREVRSP